jgi:hypothetical protein
MNDEIATHQNHQVSFAVCYLARFAEGTAPVRRFVESYQANPAGIDHELVILFKGFEDQTSKEPWREVLASLTYRELDFEDVGYDLTPYKNTADLLDHDYFLFMNTWGRFLSPNWLSLMASHIIKPVVGLVGT